MMWHFKLCSVSTRILFLFTLLSLKEEVKVNNNGLYLQHLGNTSTFLLTQLSSCKETGGTFFRIKDNDNSSSIHCNLTFSQQPQIVFWRTSIHWDKKVIEREKNKVVGSLFYMNFVPPHSLSSSSWLLPLNEVCVAMNYFFPSKNVTCNREE